jgi:hypothetical protein
MVLREESTRTSAKGEVSEKTRARGRKKGWRKEA